MFRQAHHPEHGRKGKSQIQKLKSETKSPRKMNQIDPIVCVKLSADCIQFEFRPKVAETAEKIQGPR